MARDGSREVRVSLGELGDRVVERRLVEGGRRERGRQEGGHRPKFNTAPSPPVASSHRTDPPTRRRAHTVRIARRWRQAVS
jgi:hypothetical protein